MKKPRIIDLVKVDEYSVTAKYLQIANSVIREIENGAIQVGDNMPSINELSIELDIARDTVERGYRHLKQIGVLDSVPRRGYYVANADFKRPLKVFLLFNKLSEHKKVIYDSFYAALGDHGMVDFYIYNNDVALFKRLLLNRKEGYTHFVIIPHFIEGSENAHEILDALPKDKLLLLDKVVPGITGEYAAAYENFEADIYNALLEASERLSKYHTIKIIFPESSYYPPEIVKGFRNFCQDFGFTYKVLSDVLHEEMTEGVVYINVMEDNLVSLLEKALQSKLIIGEQVGIVSYNEVPIKKLILNGLTTISTDFQQMGRMAAELILSGSKEHVAVPFKLTLRASL